MAEIMKTSFNLDSLELSNVQRKLAELRGNTGRKVCVTDVIRATFRLYNQDPQFRSTILAEVRERIPKKRRRK